MPESPAVSGQAVLEPTELNDAEAGEPTTRDAADVGQDVARQAWAVAARTRLLDIATRYNDVERYKDLADYVQVESGITTTQQFQRWIGDVLGQVSDECVRRGEPLLSALAVDRMGNVGDGYAAAVQRVFGEAPADLERHAAEQRLACHRYFKAEDLPADGGFPALTPQVISARERLARKNALLKPIDLCPNCNMQVPATGVCDDCG